MDAASLLLPVLLIAVFYFLLIRPQQKQRRQMADMQRSVGPGARVMTTAGMFGTVVSADDDEVVLEIAPGVQTRFVRRAIANVLPDDNQEPSAGIHDDTLGSSEPAAPQEDRTNGDDAR